MVEKSDAYHGGKGPRAPDQIEELLAAAAGDRQAITRLAWCGADLNAAPEAKRELDSFSAAELREARGQRRNSPGCAQ